MRIAARVVLCAALFSAAQPAWAEDGPEPATSTVSAASADSKKDQERAALEAAYEAENKKREAEIARADSAPGLVESLVKMTFMLVAVCLLAYLLLGKLLPRVLAASPSARRSMFGAPPKGLVEVVDRLALDQKRWVYVIKVADKYFLVGAADHGMNLISRLDATDVEEAGEQKKEGSILSNFPALLSRQREKESSS